MRFVFSDSSAALFFASRLKFHWAPVLVPGFSAHPKLWGQWWTLIATTDTFHHDHPPTLLLITQFSLCGTTIINSYSISGKTSQRKKNTFSFGHCIWGWGFPNWFCRIFKREKDAHIVHVRGGLSEVILTLFPKWTSCPNCVGRFVLDFLGDNIFWDLWHVEIILVDHWVSPKGAPTTTSVPSLSGNKVWGQFSFFFTSPTNMTITKHTSITINRVTTGSTTKTTHHNQHQ